MGVSASRRLLGLTLLEAPDVKTNHAILTIAATLLAGLNAIAAAAAEDNWPQFLGPGARAVSANASLPDRWSAAENVEWKQEIPGRGWSSPVAWGNRVFLTTVVEEGKEGGKKEKPQSGFFMGGKGPGSGNAKCQWKVFCLDLLSGKVLWERTVHEGTPPGPTHAKNSYASETPVTDGERVYAYFGNVGVFCFDFSGMPVWSEKIEPHAMKMGWGTAISPVLDGDRLYIVNDNEESSYLLALNKLTGKKVWRVDRDEKSNWSTPLVWKNEKRTEIVTAGSGKVRSYDLAGKVLWSFVGMSRITVATPYADGGLLYVTSGFTMDPHRPMYAIRPGASGDITLADDKTSNGSIAWNRPVGAPYIPTTLVYDGRLYVLLDRGMMSAYDAKSGKPLYEQKRIPEGKHFTSSPWADNGRVFCVNEEGVTFVVRAGDKFELLRKNPLADDDSCLATPAMIGDRLLIRTLSRIYCIRKSAAKGSKGG
jgi:outer membrane protein assembly factor BamB